MNKRTLRFNAIDALLLLLIAAIVFLVFYVFVFEKEESGTSSPDGLKTIQYVVSVQNIDEDFVSRIVPGVTVKESVEKRVIGKIVGVQHTPMVKSSFDYESGRQVESAVEGRVNFKITLEAQVTESDQAFTSNGREIRIGELYGLMMPEFFCSGYCIDIDDTLTN